MADPDPAHDVAVSLRGLGKTYSSAAGPVEAVAGLDLEVRRGEIFGLLGPNGAGKTTTIRMLCGLLEPSTGDAQVEGASVRQDPDRVRAQVGLVPGEAGHHELLTVDEELTYYGALFGLEPRTVAERAGPLLERLELGGRRQHRLKTFSKGMRRKVHLVRALLHQPRVLLLDEPTAALDPAVAEEVWRLLLELTSERAMTVILCSHHLEEVERLCQRVAIIRRRLLVQGELSQLSGGSRRFRIGLAGEPDLATLTSVLDDLAGVDQVRAGAAENGTPAGLELELADAPETVVPAAIGALVAAGARIVRAEPVGTDLRALYREIVSAEPAPGLVGQEASTR